MEIAEFVRSQFESRSAIAIRGGNSRSFFGGTCDGAVLDVSSHAGIIDYEPRELVLRARAGTTLVSLIDVLRSEGQVFGFEPPVFSDHSTLGGAIATGLSGARRPWSGAARDFVLGVGLVTGEGKHMEFGGQVMKNVAGFDVSRLVTGAFGTLGVLTDISLKVLPAPEQEITVAGRYSCEDALARMIELSNSPYPVSGLCFVEDTLYLRLSGTASGVNAAASAVEGDMVDDFDWAACSDLSWFSEAQEIWRVSVPATAPDLLAESSMIDWGGCQRWIIDPGFNPRDDLTTGHATLMVDRGKSGIAPFSSLPPVVARIHQDLRETLDPAGILNPGKFNT